MSAIHTTYCRSTGSLKSIINHAELNNAYDGKDQSLPASELTIAAAVQQEKYRSLLIGKWHLGNAWGRGVCLYQVSVWSTSQHSTAQHSTAHHRTVHHRTAHHRTAHHTACLVVDMPYHSALLMEERLLYENNFTFIRIRTFVVYRWKTLPVWHVFSYSCGNITQAMKMNPCHFHGGLTKPLASIWGSDIWPHLIAKRKIVHLQMALINSCGRIAHMRYRWARARSRQYCCVLLCCVVMFHDVVLIMCCYCVLL